LKKQIPQSGIKTSWLPVLLSHLALTRLKKQIPQGGIKT